MPVKRYHIIIIITISSILLMGLLLLKFSIIPFVSNLPWWVIFLFTTTSILASIKLGLVIAAERGKIKTEKEGALNAVVGAIMGLLAFILAFTFGATTTKLETKKALLLEEVTAIETLFNCTHFLPDTLRQRAQYLTKDYAQIRLDVTKHPEDLNRLLLKAEGIQKTLLQYGVYLSHQKLPNPGVVSLYSDALNHVIAVQTKRLTIATSQLPAILWVNLYAITFFAMVSIGYLFGRKENANGTILLLLALSFSAVIVLIADLDRNSTNYDRIIVLDNKPMQRMLDKISR